MYPKILISFLLLWLLPLVMQGQEGGMGGILEVQLTVQNNRLQVQNGTLSPEGLYPATSKQELIRLLNDGFLRLDSLMRTEAAQWCTNGLCSWLTDFREDYLILTEMEGEVIAIVDNYFANLDTWVLSELFQDFILPTLQTHALNGTPITVADLDLAEEDIENFVFEFPIHPPLLLTEMDIIWLDKDTFSSRKTRRILKGWDGQLFYKNKIELQLKEYFFHLPFDPLFEIAPTNIRILAPRMGRFLVRTRQMEDADRMAYQWLPHRLYKKFLQKNKDSIAIESGIKEAIYPFNLLKTVDNQVNQLPIMPTSRLGLWQNQLASQRYALNVNPVPSNFVSSFPLAEQSRFLDLMVNQLTASYDSTNIAPSPPNLAGELLAEDYTTPLPASAPRLTKFKRNYLGIGGSWNWRDETSLRLLFRHLFLDNSQVNFEISYLFNEAGWNDGGVAISGNYTKDYLFFNALKKRLFLRITAQSDFTANRVLQQQALKERRNTTNVLTRIDWFRNQTQALLQSSLQWQIEQVQVEDFENQPFSEDRIFSTEWKNLWFLANPWRRQNNRWQIENSLKFGWLSDSNAEENTFFIKGDLQLHYFQHFGGGNALDIRLRAANSSNQTPWYEQHGHQVSHNRGFRQDAIIGQSFYQANLEWQLPFPRFGNKTANFNRYTYQHLRLAVFSDWSWYQTTGGDNLQLWSPGMGIRLKMPGVQVNFDWARGTSNVLYPEKPVLFSMNLYLDSPF